MNWSDVEKYDYALPKELIRTRGVEPRDEARLFVYDTKTNQVTLDVFRNLSLYLPEDSLLVLNNTRVLPARLWLKKETGGKIEVFILLNQWQAGESIPFLVDRKVTIGQMLYFPDGEYLTVVDQKENIFLGELSLGSEHLEGFLSRYGETPIPHYLEDLSLDEDSLRARYQTIFAKENDSKRASVAAPTASLHFTERVFASLETKNIEKTEIRLDVGLGTFAPLGESAFISGKLHQEYVSVSAESSQLINQAKAESRPVIAVGTTVTRTLEALTTEGRVKNYEGPVDIFLFPPYQFQTVDILLTNFHLPKTSLLLLVEAFLQSKESERDVMSLYEEAIEKKFAFYSFGDSMLIL